VPIIQAFAPARIQAPDSYTEHAETDPDHDTERPEDHADRRFLIVRDRIEPCERRVGIVLEHGRGSSGDSDRAFDRLRLAVRNSEQDQGRTIKVALVMDFPSPSPLRLMLQCAEAVQIACNNLQRHGKHFARMLVRFVLQQVPGTHSPDKQNSR
jgi:hypothetical protein